MRESAVGRRMPGVVFGVVTHEAGAQFVGRDAEEVRAREIAFSQTMADRDLDAFISLISPEAVFLQRKSTLERDR